MRVSPLLLLLAGAAAPVAAQQSKPVQNPTVVLVGGPRSGTPPRISPWRGPTRTGSGPADNPYQLWRDRGKTVVLAFYPKDFTSGCTAEMQTFADQYDTLFGPDVIVVGINAD